MNSPLTALLNLPGHGRSPGEPRSTSLVGHLPSSGLSAIGRNTRSAQLRLECRDLLTINRSKRTFLLNTKRRIVMAQPRGEVLQGTLDLIVLKTLEALG